MVHTIIPVIILFYSTSVSMHILTHQGNFRTVFRPISLVILTTCFGFFSFALSESPVLNDFAYLGISGILGVYIGANILFYPQIYEFQNKERLSGFILTQTLPIKWILIILVPVLFLSYPGLQKLKSEIYSLAVLPKKDKAYIDHLYTENTVGPYFPLEFIVDESKMARKDISRWIHDVYDLEEIGAVLYYNRLSPLLNKKLLGYQSKSNDNLYRITFFIPLMSTSDGLRLVNHINTISDAIFPQMKPQLTGFMTIYSQLANDLLSNFINSLLWAFGLIFIVMLLFLRNWKLTLIAMIVNILPVTFMLAIMGWLHIRLDMVTIPIGALLFSIVVDDTIHVLFWFKKTNSVKQAISNSSQGIVLTSIMLALGFSVFLISDVPPIASFGLLSLIAIVMALISDIILLPSLLKFTYGNN
ncbi:MAG: hypothetical protein MUP24_12470 [Gillisia sp.]|nr:hypothetical protein [Gillisia sp.]